MLPDDSDHDSIAVKLCELLNDGPANITSSVFDALSNLCLTEDVKQTVYDLAVGFLSATCVQDIPVIMKYLLRSCETTDSAKQVRIKGCKYQCTIDSFVFKTYSNYTIFHHDALQSSEISSAAHLCLLLFSLF